MSTLLNNQITKSKMWPFKEFNDLYGQSLCCCCFLTCHNNVDNHWELKNLIKRISKKKIFTLLWNIENAEFFKNELI